MESKLLIFEMVINIRISIELFWVDLNSYNFKFSPMEPNIKKIALEMKFTKTYL